MHSAEVKFGYGSSEGVIEYLKSLVPEIAKSLNMSQDEEVELGNLIEAIFLDIKDSFMEDMRKGIISPTIEGEKLFELLGEKLVLPTSRLIGKSNLDEAREFLNQGGNILLIQNHKSGGDVLLMNSLLSRNGYSDIIDSMGVISGYSVNAFLMRAVFASAITRFPVYQKKYITGRDRLEVSRRDMVSQNKTTLTRLGNYSLEGGKVIVLYPEGGSSDNGMKEGEPETMKIAQVISDHSNNGFKIMPTYVLGGNDIIPRGQNVGKQRHKTFSLVRPTSGIFSVGSLINWDVLNRFIETPSNVIFFVNQILGGDNNLHPKHFRNRFMVDVLMGKISELSIPCGEIDSPYNDEKLKQLVASL